MSFQFFQHVQLVSNIFRFSKHVRIPKHFQVVPDFFGCFPTCSDVSQHVQIAPNIVMLFPTFSDCSQHFQMFPTNSDFTNPVSLLGTKNLALGPVGLFDQTTRQQERDT